jgi:hypothetical protein
MSDAPLPTAATFELAERIRHLPPEQLPLLVALLMEQLGYAKAPPAVPPGAVDEKEVKRRARFLVSRAERADFGRPICPFCGKTSPSNNALENHLRRTHTADVAELGAWRFPTIR